MLITQGYGTVGIALYGNALGVLQHIADKHSSADLVDNGVISEGLTLLD
jgi:hypothetical protein